MSHMQHTNVNSVVAQPSWLWGEPRRLSGLIVALWRTRQDAGRTTRIALELGIDVSGFFAAAGCHVERSRDISNHSQKEKTARDFATS